MPHANEPDEDNHDLRSPDTSLLHHLIIVCCHAIWKGGNTKGQAESEWVIEDYQRGETGTFIKHIELGLEEARKDENAMVLFSGGATKRDRTPLTEGKSYLNLAQAIIGSNEPALKARLDAEIFATDSYQNLLFGIVAFELITKRYPNHIIIISHDFKKGRFMDYHCKAIRWPETQTKFIGFDPPPEVTPRHELDAAEAQTIELWKKDLYGVTTDLGVKRLHRGWRYEVSLIDMQSDGSKPGDDVQDLLRYDGGEDKNTIFPGSLPWTALNGIHDKLTNISLNSPPPSPGVLGSSTRSRPSGELLTSD